LCFSHPSSQGHRIVEILQKVSENITHFRPIINFLVRKTCQRHRSYDFVTAMTRRDFLEKTTGAAAVWQFGPLPVTKHLIFIVTAGVRAKDYLNSEKLAPNISALARAGFVFEQDHCERIASHRAAFMELLQGREFTRNNACPTILDYVGRSVFLDSAQNVISVLEHNRPRILVCRECTHDAGHVRYEDYLREVEATDARIGRVFRWVKSHPYFSGNTAIVIRPEFGRDDEVNEHGQLHHSYGFDCTHRVASIFWGPDFNRGVDTTTVINTLDMAPTLTRLFGVEAIHAQGRVIPGLFKT
jgi:hypothetical protein